MVIDVFIDGIVWFPARRDSGILREAARQAVGMRVTFRTLHARSGLSGEKSAGCGGGGSLPQVEVVSYLATAGASIKI